VYSLAVPKDFLFFSWNTGLDGIADGRRMLLACGLFEDATFHESGIVAGLAYVRLAADDRRVPKLEAELRRQAGVRRLQCVPIELSA
jgi:hypothetical protein